MFCESKFYHFSSFLQNRSPATVITPLNGLYNYLEIKSAMQLIYTTNIFFKRSFFYLHFTYKENHMHSFIHPSDRSFIRRQHSDGEPQCCEWKLKKEKMYERITSEYRKCIHFNMYISNKTPCNDNHYLNCIKYSTPFTTGILIYNRVGKFISMHVWREYKCIM